MKAKMTLLTFILLGMAAPAFAFGPCGPGKEMHGKVEARLAKLKEALKITPAQEGAWDEYAKRTESLVGTLREGRTDEPMTAPERLDRRIDRMKRRLALLENMDEAFKNLYGALTPEQKSIADKRFAGMRRR